MSTRSDDNRRDAVRGARRAMSGTVDVDLALLAAVQDGLLDVAGTRSPWRGVAAVHAAEHVGLAGDRVKTRVRVGYFDQVQKHGA